MADTIKKHYAPSDGRSAEERALKRFAEMIGKKVETIQSDRKKTWFTENTPSWPKYLSGKECNGMNGLMLLLHCEAEGYQIPVFMTFDQVRGLNYEGNIKEEKRLVDQRGKLMPEVLVLKGAKSFPALLTRFSVEHVETKHKIKFDDYKKLSKAEQGSYTVYSNLQVYNVFNVDQTNIREVRPELYAKFKKENVALPSEISADGFCFPAMDEMIKNNEWLCPISLKHQNDAYYSIIKDEIILPEKELFNDPELFYGTGLCEMIHSTGAQNRLHWYKRDNNAEEELVTELSSALIMQKNGLSKIVNEENCAYLKFWLKELKESSASIKNLLLNVNRATAMVNEKIDIFNFRLSETISEKQTVERLPVTYIPDEALSEFHMLDNESRDAVYRVLLENMYDKDTGKIVKDVGKPADRIVRVGGKYFDEALECVFDILDSETLSKIVDCGNYINGYLLEKYTSALSLKFTQEFEKKRNDPNWLKAQGIEGDVKWNLNFISTDGYFLAKAELKDRCKLGALDHNCSIFRPFVDIGKAFTIEDDLGYMTELRRRLLSKDEKVDPLGRITFAAPPVHYPDTGNVRRDIYIDGEAAAVFVLEQDCDIYKLNFVLELKKTELVESYSKSCPDYIIHDKEADVYYVMVDSIYDLFREKDQFYPARVINDEMNVALDDFLNLPVHKKPEPVMQVPNEYVVVDRVNEDVIEEKTEVHAGLFAFRNNDKLWGLQDSEGRIAVPPRWEYFEQKEGNKDIEFNSFVYGDGEMLSHASLSLQKDELADMANKFSRLSNVRIEERGEHDERWIAADINGKPVVGEKISDSDWIQYQESVSSLLELAKIHFAPYLDYSQDEQMRNGIRV